ncbi:MAG TPA: ANTAR domain-containing protein, partial [Pseudonocardiaceae bacterium]|nr:ANTAR domain-containing protein [Pseudonocardiaceae bacterium]
GGALASLAELPDTGAGELDRVRALARMLPGAMQTRPVIEGAMRVVRDRYDLADTDQAFELLRRVSQQHNVRLRTLAAAVLTVRPPDPGSARWFPGRLRQAPPSVTFAEPHRQWRDSRSAFLSDVLDNALACMRTDHGDLQLIDRVVGGLRLEVQRGLPREFVGLFAHVTDDSTRAAAVQSGHRVVVADVATSPAYAEPAARAAMLAANGRAIQSTPLVAPDGHCHGMVSTLDGHPGRTPSPAEEAALDRIGREAGAWLAWHQRTVVLDVLEDVHDAARRAR